MTLRGYSYALLEIVRNSHIVDDERISLRLLDEFIRNNREDYIQRHSKYNGDNELLRQSMPVAMTLDTTNSDPSVLISSSNVPSFIEGKYGPMLDEIKGTNNMAYTFTIVPFNRFRLCGNRRFNSNIIFASVHDKNIYIRSRNDTFRVIEDIVVEGVFSDPMSVLDSSGSPQLTPDVGDYPMDGEIFNYIKELVKKDISFMLKTPSDEVNDSSGDIITA
jgi:hypothetical protein